MIKLIVSDMDGTLLNHQCEMEPGTIEMIHQLKKRGIIFAAASGRQYTGMVRFFEEVKDDIYFIAENGAFAMYQNQELYSSVMDQKLVREILDEVNKTDPAEVFLCGKNITYTDKPEAFKRLQQKTHRYEAKLVKNLYEVEDDIVKISISERNSGTRESFLKMQPIFQDKTEIAVSGLIWYDLMNKNVNKGNTLEKIQASLGIRPEETMAFGDNYNDITMLLRASESYVMAGAEEGVKKFGKYVIGGQNEWSVVKEIKKVLHLEEGNNLTGNTE